ncbi:MAG: hypothetical protein K0M56_02170 [Kaistella sp.]|nr:hypothetical protein [Kaistella sp.]
MSLRFRIGPFTFGKTGIRFSSWRRGTGFSLPLSGNNAQFFGRIKLGSLSYYFRGKSERRNPKHPEPSKISEFKKYYGKAYEPWTVEADKKLMILYLQGSTPEELSVIFGRTKGAICSRIKKLS